MSWTREVSLRLAFGCLHLILQGLLANGILVGDLHQSAHGGDSTSGQLVSKEIVPDAVQEGVDSLVFWHILD